MVKKIGTWVGMYDLLRMVISLVRHIDLESGTLVPLLVLT
jgi:hypothetical protein